MRNLSYLIRRISSMNYKAMFDTINIVHEKTCKNRFLIFFDVVYCGLKYQAGYVDYELFEMYNLNKYQRKTILTRGINNSYIKKYNNKNYIYIFENKKNTNMLYNEFLNRDWLYINDCSKEDFKYFISKHNEFMVKPVEGTCGKGIKKISIGDYEFDELYNYIATKGDVIVEEIIKQHPKMNKMYPDSINTLRIISFLKNDDVKIVAAYLRVGNGTYVDNFNSGGMVVPINIKNGTIEYNALDKKHNIYETHPTTGTKFIGFEIPMWQESLEFV